MNIDFDSADFGLPSSFNYTNKPNMFEMKLPNLMANIAEAPIDDPASFCHYLKTTDGKEKKIMQFNKGSVLFLISLAGGGR